MSSNKARLKQHFVIHNGSGMAPGLYGYNDPGRMKDVASVIQTVVPECLESDADGIDISFVNTDFAMTNIQTRKDVGGLIMGIKAEGEWYPVSSFCRWSCKTQRYLKYALMPLPQDGNADSKIWSGVTPIDKRLKTLVDDYWDNFDPENTHPKNFIIIGDAQAISLNEAINPSPLIETILGSCLEALRKDVDPQTVTFRFLHVGNPDKMDIPVRKHEIDRYAECCNKAAFALDGLQAKYFDLLRKKIVDEPKLKEYATEIKDSSDLSLGRFDIVSMKGQWADLSVEILLEAMKGARDKR